MILKIYLNKLQISFKWLKISLSLLYHISRSFDVEKCDDKDDDKKEENNEENTNENDDESGEEFFDA